MKVIKLITNQLSPKELPLNQETARVLKLQQKKKVKDYTRAHLWIV